MAQESFTPPPPPNSRASRALNPISAPKGPIALKFCMDVKTHVKSIATNAFLQKTVYLLYYYNLCKSDAYYHIFINISNKYM